MIYKNEILDLKTDITEKIGQKIIVKGSLGRTKSFEKEATIEKTYPNIFVIKYEEDDRNVTYSYTDILTRTVEVEVFDGVGYSPLIPFFPSRSSSSISFIVKKFFSSVIAIFSATISGSIKSIKILAGDDAKLAPASISPS